MHPCLILVLGFPWISSMAETPGMAKILEEHGVFLHYAGQSH